MDLEHEQRLTAVEERSKSNSHRLDKLEESNEVISRLATSMEVMANKQERSRTPLTSWTARSRLWNGSRGSAGTGSWKS